jgi:hypothetical protein
MGLLDWLRGRKKKVKEAPPLVEEEKPSEIAEKPKTKVIEKRAAEKPKSKRRKRKKAE